jgi:hypothetical protein
MRLPTAPCFVDSISLMTAHTSNLVRRHDPAGHFLLGRRYWLLRDSTEAPRSEPRRWLS